jgi:hypothetical protein
MLVLGKMVSPSNQKCRGRRAVWLTEAAAASPSKKPSSLRKNVMAEKHDRKWNTPIRMQGTTIYELGRSSSHVPFHLLHLHDALNVKIQMTAKRGSREHANASLVARAS